MRHKVFHDYCAWLFPLLEEFDRRVDITGYSVPEQRIDGYLAERLLGVYRTFLKDRIKILEIPGVEFIPENGKRWKCKLLAASLSPGTKHRAVVKRLCKGCIKWKNRNLSYDPA